MDTKKLPSCSLSGAEQDTRLQFLKEELFSKAIAIEELETGYSIVFQESIAFSNELLDFVNFERCCCASFTWALVFEPHNTATCVQMYGSEAIKKELKEGLAKYGLVEQLGLNTGDRPRS